MNKLIKIKKTASHRTSIIASLIRQIHKKKPPEPKRVPTVNINTTTQMYL